ncbi:MAG: diaminopimelate epimerase [Actinobacteria bacterium]|uniref:diaminopimelate epimerase n=1 Tax=freshwater metagenome TaxID=449393 RepID=A0A6J6V0Z7_9ZZZZ|nr:diaminopimelate epimerase [Actinomycetota bacterium]MTB14242.1 diaminopimelate epimerase [Actinomycetota bacterium]
MTPSTPLRATKGHGTENEFILIPEGNLSPSDIASLCNRNSGVGADGLIQIKQRDGHWFMDYRNSDGSLAEMCGNGIRVMAKYLYDRGLESRTSFDIDTRAGIKRIEIKADGRISAGMGAVVIEPGTPTVTYGGNSWLGFKVSVGNPHAVVFLESLALLPEVLEKPTVTPARLFPDGVNVEFVEILGERHLSMRVFERGVGETRSCGTGTCAVAVAAAAQAGVVGASTWRVDVLGGSLEIDIDALGEVTMTGPAVLVNDFEVNIDE